ncbi:translation initiation factor IF-2-like [Elephas maximus indicus]|uniref:translation initiation factor IF-2-like n=1 Tax=Elephas maximus indicus TaxID=99487 RepID=UPI002116FCBD|nr:translation initiation factor IF-2-like [Elephas maximus indicus]
MPGIQARGLASPSRGGSPRRRRFSEACSPRLSTPSPSCPAAPKERAAPFGTEAWGAGGGLPRAKAEPGSSHLPGAKEKTLLSPLQAPAPAPSVGPGLGPRCSRPTRSSCSSHWARQARSLRLASRARPSAARRSATPNGAAGHFPGQPGQALERAGPRTSWPRLRGSRPVARREAASQQSGQLYCFCFVCRAPPSGRMMDGSPSGLMVKSSADNQKDLQFKSTRSCLKTQRGSSTLSYSVAMDESPGGLMVRSSADNQKGLQFKLTSHCLETLWGSSTLSYRVTMSWN